MLVYPEGKSANDFPLESVPDYRNDDYYNVQYSKPQIDVFLKRVKRCIRAGRFVVLNNENGNRESRQKNLDFLARYGLYMRENQADFLLGICTEDFCHSVKSADGSVLYVFCVRRVLYKAGHGPCSVWVYVKHDCPEEKDATDVVVSLHELERPIDLLFVD